MQGKLDKAATFAQWAHVDVADGEFTATSSWNEPESWAQFSSTLDLEVHLMVSDPLPWVQRWCGAGAKRIIVHQEALRRTAGEHAVDLAHQISQVCTVSNAHFVIAINPETPPEVLASFVQVTDFFQILAVHPGPAGQEMAPGIVEKVRAVRQLFPQSTIEVDGGIVPETARAVREAGADIAIAGSYTLNSDDPKEAYEELRQA